LDRGFEEVWLKTNRMHPVVRYVAAAAATLCPRVPEAPSGQEPVTP